MVRRGFITRFRLTPLVLAFPGLLCLGGHPAQAADPIGPYVGLFGGVVIPQSETWKGDIDDNGRGDRFDASLNAGPLAGVVSGYDYGAWRFEIEGAYRRGGADRAKKVQADGFDRGTRDLGGHVNVWSVLANGYYDFDAGTSVTPFVGIGLGVASVSAKGLDVQGLGLSVDGSDAGFAYQGLAGVKMALSADLSVNASYRYFGTAGLRIDGVKTTYHAQALTAGLTYTLLSDILPDFNPPPLNPPPKPSDASFARSYVVFFDWDSAALSDEARAIIADAAKAAISLGTARIELTGHADRSGSASYNLALSNRRAAAVKQELMGLGMAAHDIVAVGRGETAPLVPTPDGVREPQNRRVEIAL